LQSTLSEIEALGLIFTEVESLDESTFSHPWIKLSKSWRPEVSRSGDSSRSLPTRTIRPLNRRSKLGPGDLLRANLKKEEIGELKAVGIA
jgi:hypothetical protein